MGDLNPNEERLKFLKLKVDLMIKNGWAGICSEQSSFTEHDITLIQDYANSLGLKAFLGYCPPGPGHAYHEGVRKASLDLKPQPVENICDQDRIYVAQKDYDLLRFCRSNWFCQLLYRLKGK